MQPLAIDLFCGLGGWTEGLLAEGYRVVGFDNERHEYGEAKYPAQLVIQDVLTLHGSQFKDAALIVASPPCQEYSYMAMPWTLAKEKRTRILADPAEQSRLTALFDVCFRLQREASEAAGRHVPLIVENVRGAQDWVGKAPWHFGSFYLWGDIPALMPIIKSATKVPMPVGGDSLKVGFQQMAVLQQREGIKATGMNWSDQTKRGQDFTRIAGRQSEGIKHGGDCFSDPTWAGRQGGTKQPGISGVRANGKGDRWFQDGAAKNGSKSKARKAASAAIAKIPLVLAQHIARVYKPTESK